MSSLSPESTITEMREIEAKIKKIRADFRKELINSKKPIFDRTEKTLRKLRQERQDEFETEQEFKNRVAKKRRVAEKEEADEVRPLESKIESEYRKQIAPFIKTLKKLSRNEFTLTSNDLVLEVSKYNPSSNAFPVTIRAKQPIKGIMVAANANIPIPRQEARTFKQHFQNNIFRPELSGHFDSLESFRKMQAYIIDDATNKQYNLFPPSRAKSEYDVGEKYASLRIVRRVGQFIVYNNDVVKDNKIGFEWYPGPNSDINWYASKSWAENLSLDGHGWRMPTRRELKQLHKKGGMKLLLKSSGKTVTYIWSGERVDWPYEAAARRFTFDDNRNEWGECNDAHSYRVFAVRSR